MESAIPATTHCESEQDQTMPRSCSAQSPFAMQRVPMQPSLSGTNTTARTPLSFGLNLPQPVILLPGNDAQPGTKALGPFRRLSGPQYPSQPDVSIATQGAAPCPQRDAVSAQASGKSTAGKAVAGADAPREEQQAQGDNEQPAGQERRSRQSQRQRRKSSKKKRGSQQWKPKEVQEQPQAQNCPQQPQSAPQPQPQPQQLLGNRVPPTANIRPIGLPNGSQSARIHMPPPFTSIGISQPRLSLPGGPTLGSWPGNVTASTTHSAQLNTSLVPAHADDQPLSRLQFQYDSAPKNFFMGMEQRLASGHIKKGVRNRASYINNRKSLLGTGLGSVYDMWNSEDVQAVFLGHDRVSLAKGMGIPVPEGAIHSTGLLVIRRSMCDDAQWGAVQAIADGSQQ